MTMKLKEIQKEVHTWAIANFGFNQSSVESLTYLNELAPLMGIGEELGELFESDNEYLMRDAIGDIGIYLCDFASRLEIELPEPDRPSLQTDEYEIIRQVGRLFHHNLKRHQGIRGYEDNQFFMGEVKVTITSLINSLERFCLVVFVENETFPEIVHQTWKGVVKKRNWKTDPHNGEQ